MVNKSDHVLPIPLAPQALQKGVLLKQVLDRGAAQRIAYNIGHGFSDFDKGLFLRHALVDLEPKGIMARGQQFADALHQCLPTDYESAINIILGSLTPPLKNTEGNGLEVFFYLPHTLFIAKYGLPDDEASLNWMFDRSMHAQYELTKRFTAEFSIRPFLLNYQERVLAQLTDWALDPDPHVRRLCSEGTRPRLPWAKKLPSLVSDPGPVLPILEKLKNDPELYVRRSVANHLGDIAKDHPDLVFQLCQRWLGEASNELRWVIRHALRHPAKKGNQMALEIRASARPLASAVRGG